MLLIGRRLVAIGLRLFWVRHDLGNLAEQQMDCLTCLACCVRVDWNTDGCRTFYHTVTPEASNTC